MRAVSAIVPAAGLSRRMGGPNKLLLPWQDTTVVGAVVRKLLQGGLDVVVVTGRDSGEVEKAVAPARTVFNPRFEEGLGTSIAAGVAQCASSDGFLIALGDMPALSVDTVRILIDRFEEEERDAIVAPVYEEEPDRIGHPILFGAIYREHLLSLAGDVGARAVLQIHAEKVIQVPVKGHLDDLDTPTTS